MLTRHPFTTRFRPPSPSPLALRNHPLNQVASIQQTSQAMASHHNSLIAAVQYRFASMLPHCTLCDHSSGRAPCSLAQSLSLSPTNKAFHKCECVESQLLNAPHAFATPTSVHAHLLRTLTTITSLSFCHSFNQSSHHDNTQLRVDTWRVDTHTHTQHACHVTCNTQSTPSVHARRSDIWPPTFVSCLHSPFPPSIHPRMLLPPSSTLSLCHSATCIARISNLPAIHLRRDAQRCGSSSSACPTPPPHHTPCAHRTSQGLPTPHFPFQSPQSSTTQYDCTRIGEADTTRGVAVQDSAGQGDLIVGWHYRSTTQTHVVANPTHPFSLSPWLRPV
ncbi:hypothetical protein EmuJ_000414700 [Echinococcus multilocularis]|uniref:Uncharacterized protein n=1 Tax=Echinococcus multilocularis TaxID=6211 RepID=A0A068XX15_ECHMU|nr:hypothetical protein EmuJ_000414700 [Echinococcus multilocularis]